MFRAWIRILVCFGLATMLLGLFLTGEISLLVAPKMRWFVGFSIFVLMVLGLVQLWQLKSKELHPLGFISYLFVFFPLLLFLFVPPKVLDASIANKKGVHYSQPKAQQNTALDPSQDPYAKEFAVLKKQNTIVINDKNYGKVMTTIQIHPKELAGKQIRVTGFVYRDETTAKNQFVVGRYLMVCCTADAEVVGYLVNGGQPQPPVNRWVEVTGILKTNIGEDGVVEPMILPEQIKPIAVPKDPYVYFS